MREGAIAKWLCTGLQIRSQRFDSASRLQHFSATEVETVRAGVAQLVERNLAKVEVASSRLVSRSTQKVSSHQPQCCAEASPKDAGVAQLVERNLAKVEVASSRLVSRSTQKVSSHQPQCCAEASPKDAGVAQLVERNLAKVEVASSRLVSRSILSFPRFQIPAEALLSSFVVSAVLSSPDIVS